MKKIFKSYITLIIALSIAILNGCTKLDETVYSEIVVGNFVATQNDLPSLMIPVYTPLRSLMAGYKHLFEVNEESGDAMITPVRPNGWGGIKWLHLHEWTSTLDMNSNIWAKCYLGINSANRVIYQIESGSVPVASGKANIIAELKTARAFYYYILLDHFGNVPIVTDFSDATLPKQSTRQQLYDFVVKELNDNLSLLSVNVDRLTYGKFNKWAAKATLAKIYLNAGVYTGTQQWDKCIAECNDIINQANTKSSYGLEAKYKDIFKTNNENSKELVFAIPYDDIFATENNIHMKTLDPLMQQVFSMEVQPWGGSCAVPQFINTYDKDDSRLKDTWFQGWQYNAVTGQPVINYVNTVASMDLAGNNEGYRIGKYEIRMGAKNCLSNDFPVFRYADILMMKAECLLRTGNANDAAALVTQVRQRNFASNPAKAVVTGADLLSGSSYNYAYWNNGTYTQIQGGADIQYGRFLDELGWEFAAEAHRRPDMIRFGVFTTKIWFQHKTSSKDKIIFPIPQAELNKNPNLKQNPSY